MGYVVYYRVLQEELDYKEQSLMEQEKYINNFFNQLRCCEESKDEHNEDNLSVLDTTIVAKFTDIEDDEKTDRDGFKEALLLCKEEKHTLVVSEVKRISFHLSVVAEVMDKIKLKVAKTPKASNFELHIESIHLERDVELKQKLGHNIRVCNRIDYFKTAENERLIKRYTKLYNDGVLEKEIFNNLIRDIGTV